MQREVEGEEERSHEVFDLLCQLDDNPTIVGAPGTRNALEPNLGTTFKLGIRLR